MSEATTKRELCDDWDTATMQAEIERLTAELADMTEARNCVSEVLWWAIAERVGGQCVAIDLAGKKQFVERLCRTLGCAPHQIEDAVDRMAKELARLRDSTGCANEGNKFCAGYKAAEAAKEKA